MSLLTTERIGAVIAGRAIVRDATLRVDAGEVVALLGPNGAGKSTLLRLTLGLQAPQTGSARIGADDIAGMSAVERARRVAYLPQERPLGWPIRVRDVVALGRYAHGVTLGRLKGADADAVERAILACDLSALADRAADTLSGGEAARMHCARAFAAEAPLLIADEPVAALDPLHQHRVLGLIRDFADAGGGALVVLHDLSLAARYAERLIWMKDGAIVAEGGVAQTMTAERIEAIYSVRAKIEIDKGRPSPVIIGPA